MTARAAVRCRALALAAILGLASGARGAEVFVDAGAGSEANDGRSWATATQTIGRALSIADATLETDMVFVAEGTYRERLIVPPGVQLLGSFPPGGGTSDLRLHPSIIDAEGLGRCVEFGAGTDGGLLDGFVVRNGDAGTNGDGGGVLVTNTSPTIRRCIFEGNSGRRGAAVYFLLYDATTSQVPRLEQCIVRQSTPAEGCAAVEVFLQYTVTPQDFLITDCLIENTLSASLPWAARPTHGLAVYPYGGAARVERVIVRGGASDGARFERTSNAIELVNCEFSGNAGVQLWVPVESFDDGSIRGRVLIENCTVVGGTDRIRGIPPEAWNMMPDYTIRRCIMGPTRPHLSMERLDASLGNRLIPTPENITDNAMADADPGNNWGNSTTLPTFASGRWGDYCLSQVAAGQSIDSFGVDESPDLAANTGLDVVTTRTDDMSDIGQADHGVHYWPLGVWGSVAPTLEILRGNDPRTLPFFASTDALPWLDAPGELSDSSEPIVFYTVTGAANDIRVEKDMTQDTLRLRF